MPIIKLGTESYKHKAYGRTDKPVLHLVRWTSEGGAAPASAAEYSRTKFHSEKGEMEERRLL